MFQYICAVDIDMFVYLRALTIFIGVALITHTMPVRKENICIKRSPHSWKRY